MILAWGQDPPATIWEAKGRAPLQRHLLPPTRTRRSSGAKSRRWRGIWRMSQACSKILRGRLSIIKILWISMWRAYIQTMHQWMLKISSLLNVRVLLVTEASQELNYVTIKPLSNRPRITKTSDLSRWIRIYQAQLKSRTLKEQDLQRQWRTQRDTLQSISKEAVVDDKHSRILRQITLRRLW